METLEHLAATIDSLDDLRSIVRTMKALAAVSIRQYERAVESLRQYRRTVDLGLQAVWHAQPATAARRTARAPGASGLVVFGSDHGLCGRFNEDLAEAARAHIRALPHPPRVLVVGERLAPLVEDVGITVEATLATPGSAPRITALVDRLLVKLERWQAESEVDIVALCFSQRRSGSRATPRVEALLPVDVEAFRALGARPWPSRSLPTVTMGRERLLAALVRQHLFVSLFRACAESQAAEHASRLAAMQRAERNLEERRVELLGEFRRRRQAVITAELLDVVAGYEAVRDRGGPSRSRPSS